MDGWAFFGQASLAKCGQRATLQAKGCRVLLFLQFASKAPNKAPYKAPYNSLAKCRKSNTLVPFGYILLLRLLIKQVETVKPSKPRVAGFYFFYILPLRLLKKLLIRPLARLFSKM